MKLLVINPNTTAAMTEQIAGVARQGARPDTEIVAVQPERGPASIQGYLDVARSLDGILDIAARHPEADATVVACFDDTGLDALRCVMQGPVVGIGEASYHAASMVSGRFSVITTLARSVPGLWQNLSRYGLAARCGNVRATDVPVLALESDPGAALHRIETEIRAAIDKDRAEAIVLGCAGMADMRQKLETKYGIPVIEGIGAAVSFAEALTANGLRTSRRGGYAC